MTPATAAHAVEQYRRWLTDETFAAQFPKLEGTRAWILDHLHELAGKDLACWCGPSSPCHVTVLLSLAARTTPGTHEAGNVPGDTPIVPFPQVEAT